MRKVISVRLDEKTVHFLDEIVDKGWSNSRREAIEEGILILYRKHKAPDLIQRINEIAKNTEGGISLTTALLESREEDDRRLDPIRPTRNPNGPKKRIKS